MQSVRAVAQLGRAPASGAGGRGFKSHQPDEKYSTGTSACAYPVPNSVVMNARFKVLFATLFLLLAGFMSPCRATVYVRPEWTRFLIKYVDPEYPIVLQRHGVGGSGIFLVKINQKTGEVDEVKVIKSTGYVILNELAAKAMLQWKFQPGAPAELKVPMTFEIKGFSRVLH